MNKLKFIWEGLSHEMMWPVTIAEVLPIICHYSASIAYVANLRILLLETIRAKKNTWIPACPLDKQHSILFALDKTYCS